jgi:hypothetical protein
MTLAILTGVWPSTSEGRYRGRFMGVHRNHGGTALVRPRNSFRPNAVEPLPLMKF